MLFQQLLEDPAVAQHAGQAGHHALGCALAVSGGVDHVVHIGAVLRPQRQALDTLIGQPELPQAAQAFGVLVLVYEGQQGIVGAE